jgi:hypothetical protein
MRATATIENHLAVDGCSYPITIAGVEYAPDRASLDAVIEHVSTSGEVMVEVEYRVTGNVGHVNCELGAVERPEIEVSFP